MVKQHLEQLLQQLRKRSQRYSLLIGGCVLNCIYDDLLMHMASRLDALMEAKAKQGVQIYILLYKEVAIALKINSVYSKRRLLSIHENVKVLRYPDHFLIGVYLWSHHEKLVIVDYRVGFIGGLDLCFGWYDTPSQRWAMCMFSLEKKNMLQLLFSWKVLWRFCLAKNHLAGKFLRIQDLWSVEA
ncbi:hypothetical protein IFM89_023392 [Coptis chinensis]|uniref:phospholipase D n=1 Tax=Coptis chinensis TaxID=261450 RepID=A0A835IXV6_9MAGN|nr:hypothetical protein IFM89_023392 [Coptis chinensis]